MSIRKWLGSKIAGINIEGLERQNSYFFKNLKEVQADYKQLIAENRFMKNQLFYGSPNINISRDNIVTLQHRMLIKDNEAETKQYILDGFRNTILNNKLFEYNIIYDEESEQKVVEIILRLIRP